MNKYVYILLKNYIQMMVYVVRGTEEELSESVLIPFAPTRISANVDGEKTKEITSLSVLSNNVNQINIFRYGTFKGEKAENMFFRSETQVSFDEMMNDLMMSTGYTSKSENPAYSQWGGLSGNISDQKDLVGMMTTKNDAPLEIRVSNQYDEVREIGGKEYRLLMNFSHLDFENGNQYVLLVDRYKPRERKGSRDVVVTDPNTGEQYMEAIPIYRSAKFYHESPIDAETNRRKSEIPIEKNAWIHVELQANKYFGTFNKEIPDGTPKELMPRMYPKPRGFRKNVSRSRAQGMVLLQFRLRTVDRFGRVISESQPLGKVKVIATATSVITYKIN